MKKKRFFPGNKWSGIKKLLLVMKLTTLFLFFSVMAMAARSYSQNARFDLNVKNATIIQVFDEIEQVTDFGFLFKTDQLDLNKRYTLDIKNTNVEKIMNEVLDKDLYSWNIIERTIVITKTGSGMSQDRSPQKVTGKVTDLTGQPLPGVTVVVKGTTVGTITDSNGKYTLTGLPDHANLVFSFVGMKSQEVPVDMPVININLQEETIGLEEVVAIGYGTMKKSDLTGSISSVDASQIQKVPVTTVSQALQGRMSGVQVTNNDGSPGSGVSVLIRGVGTFGDNTPLYVVDGYPLSGGISSLNPSDIASIDVLKDASSAAIYGNRAANGVVIITTKRGSKDGFHISFNATTSVQNRPKTYDVLDAQEFATIATEIADKEGAPILDEWRNPSSLKTIDWQEVMYRAGIKQNYNLSIRGGTDKSQSSVSLGYTDQKGIVEFSNYRRFNAAVALDFTPKKWFKSSTDIKYSYSDGKTIFGSGQGGIGRLAKLIPTMTGNPLTDEVKDKNGNYGYYTKDVTAVKDNENMYARMESNDQKNSGHNLNASTFLEFTLTDGLKIKSNFGITYNASSGYNFYPYDDRVSPARDATYSQSATNSMEWLWENTISYSKKFGIHAIDIVGGVSAQENTYRTLSSSGNGLISDELRNVGSLSTVSSSGYQQTWSLASQFGRATYKLMDRYIITATVRRDGSSRFSKGNKYGIFPSVSGAWRIKEENFMKNADAISNLKFRASYGEAGNQNIGLFQYESTYTTGSSASNNRGYIFGQTKTFYDGLVLAYLPNPDLKWETSKQTDVGLDLGFLNNKLAITADYYRKTSKDFLLDIEVPSQTGFETATRNVGSIRNTGLEFSVDYHNYDHEFKYGIRANITTVKNKILKFADGLDAVSNFSTLDFPNYGSYSWQVFSMSRVGGSIGEFYGFKTDGIIQTQTEIDALNAKAREKNGPTDYYIASGTAPGDRKFVDMDGDGMITDNDRVALGSPLPDFFGGITFDGSYKQFDFSIFFNCSYGNKIFNYAKRNLISMGGNGSVGLENISLDFYKNRWKETNPTNEYPRAVWSDVSGNSRPSDVFIENGSYLRLRNVEVGYTLPESVTGKISLSEVRFFMSAQNLFTITGYSGLDPEMGESVSSSGVSGGITAFGLDVGTYPSSRFFTLGLNIQF